MSSSDTLPGAINTSQGVDPGNPQVVLRFKRDPSGRTFIAKRYITYPFFLTTPFYLDRGLPGMPTVILQSMSGGIYQHERLAFSLTTEADAQVCLTTQSATVVHSMSQGEAHQVMRIHAAAGSWVEYWPDPLILFPGASLRTEVEVVAEAGATVILFEGFLTHDPEAKARSFRQLRGETVFQRPGENPFCIDRFQLSDWGSVIPPPYTTQGSVWIVSPEPADQLAVTLKQALEGLPGLYAGASTLPGNQGAWARLLAVDAKTLYQGFQAIWSTLRQQLTGEKPTRNHPRGRV